MAQRVASALLLTLTSILAVSAFAQEPPKQLGDSSSKTIAAHESAGLRAALGSVVVQDDKILIQFAIVNETTYRYYLYAIGSSKAFLSDGNSFSLQEVIGLPFWRDGSDQANFNDAMSNKVKDVNNFTYIEPSEYITVSYKYEIDGQRVPIDLGNTLNFAFKCIGRLAPPVPATADETGKPPSPPKLITINFPNVPLRMGG